MQEFDIGVCKLKVSLGAANFHQNTARNNRKFFYFLASNQAKLDNYNMSTFWRNLIVTATLFYTIPSH